MAGQLKLRRGTTSQLANYIGSEGELTYDTTLRSLVLHDGVTLGGVKIPYLSNDLVPSTMLPTATELVVGASKLATTAIAQAGTNDTDIITPLKLQQKLTSTVFGMNQTNKSKTIVSGTVYTHTNDIPSFLSMSMSGSGGTWANVTHNGVVLINTNASGRYIVSILVAKGDIYYISGGSIVCVELS